MLPRRSVVLKYTFCISVLLVAFFLFFTGPNNRASNTWRRVLQDIQEYGLNETKLISELDYLKSELNVTYNPANKSLSELYRVVQAMREQVPVNPHKFHFVKNPARYVCDPDEEIFLLVYVHTAPNHFKHRALIRETWGDRRNFQHLNMRVVFLLGQSTDSNVEDALTMENDMYGDIVQEDFVDAYRNLTYKAIMGLRWVTFHCSTPRFVLKVDDDIFVNMFNVINHLETMVKREAENGGVKRLLLCLVWYRMKVVRESKSKWYLSKEEFKDDYFPTYCSGSAFIMTPDVMADMYNASQYTPFFWVDDFYVTGLLAQKVGVTHQKFNSVYTLGPSTFFEKFSDESKWRTYAFGHVHNMNHIVHVWKRVLAERKLTTARQGG
jgi:hypothetical protein